MKLAVVIVCLFTIAYGEGEAALRRKPKVYNALITTDEDLEQSRAFPVIQPTIHESGIAHYPFNPYGVFNQHVIRLGQPIAPSLKTKQQPYSLPPPQFPPQVMHQPLIPQPFAGYPIPQNPPTAPEVSKIKEGPTGSEQPIQPTVQPSAMEMSVPAAEVSKNPEQANKMSMEQLPIPLNQYGLPPALIPLRQPQPYPPQAYPLPNGVQPFHLPPYRFNPFPPVYYNSLPDLRHQFLPPYNYLPTGPQFPLSNTIPTDKTYPQIPSQPLPPPPPPPVPTSAPHTSPPTSPVTLPTKSTESDVSSADPLITEPTFENIKNGSKSKDSNVPDVPPPPIPSGAKSNQS